MCNLLIIVIVLFILLIFYNNCGCDGFRGGHGHGGHGHGGYGHGHNRWNRWNSWDNWGGAAGGWYDYPYEYDDYFYNEYDPYNYFYPPIRPISRRVLT